jgi:hypothetical protein
MANTLSTLAKTYPNSLLISTPSGKILRLYTPIIASVIKPTVDYPLQGQHIYITAITESENQQLLYQIDDQFYPHTHFEILNIKPIKP